MVRLVVSFILLSLPTPLLAAVMIHEVAWMGGTASANHEWIELYNTGEATSVEGWTLTDGANLQITLSGTIEAGEFAVLERTSDESAPGSAFLIYTGALVNTGTTLTLRRSNGTTEDQVSGGENWATIGGDNVSKATAQYTVSGWITAAPTPGIINAAVPPPPPPPPPPAPTATTVAQVVTETNTTGTTPLVKKSSSSKSLATPLILPGITLRLQIIAPTTAHLNQPVDFTSSASGIGKTLVDSLRYHWNFGDGSTSSKKSITHIYRYPGTYVVTLYAEFERQEYAVRHEITVLPATVSVTKNVDGDVQINNDSPYEIDISGFKVQGIREFIFPERTFIVPKGTITLPRTRFGFTTTPVTVYDRTGKWLAATKSTQAETTVTSPTVSTVSRSTETMPDSTAFNFVQSAAVLEAPDTTVVLAATTTETKPVPLIADLKADSNKPQNSTSIYLALAAILLLATGAVLLKPNRVD